MLLLKSLVPLLLPDPFGPTVRPLTAQCGPVCDDLTVPWAQGASPPALTSLSRLPLSRLPLSWKAFSSPPHPTPSHLPKLPSLSFESALAAFPPAHKCSLCPGDKVKATLRLSRCRLPGPASHRLVFLSLNSYHHSQTWKCIFPSGYFFFPNICKHRMQCHCQL